MNFKKHLQIAPGLSYLHMTYLGLVPDYTTYDSLNTSGSNPWTSNKEYVLITVSCDQRKMNINSKFHIFYILRLVIELSSQYFGIGSYKKLRFRLLFLTYCYNNQVAVVHCIILLPSTLVLYFILSSSMFIWIRY